MNEAEEPVELDDLELERFSRQLLLPEVGERGQLALRSATAVVAGCGGLGVAAALYLAGAGVGRLRLIDPDRVSLDNLPRQIAYRTSEVGRRKAEVLARRITQLDPSLRVEIETAELGAESFDSMIEGASILLECTDSPEGKFLANDLSVARGLPVVIGGAVRFTGQVVAVPSGSPCYRCLFHGPSEGATLNCRGAGIMGPVAGIIGVTQALEAIKLLLGLNRSGGRLMDFDGLSGRWRELRFRHDPNCPAHQG